MVRTFTTHNRVLDFILVGLGMYALGFGLGVLGLLFGAKVLGTGELTDLGLAIIGMLVGFCAGIIIGLVIVRTVLHQRGSIAVGILGTVVWAAISIGVAALFNLANDASSAVVVAFFLSTPVVALAAYYLKQPADECP